MMIHRCGKAMPNKPGMRGMIHILWVLYMGIFASGCAVGPTFHRPLAPKIKHYTEQRTPNKTAASRTIGGEQQHFNIHQKISQQWWTVFQSKVLNQLIQEALQANPDLKAAEASLQMAHEAAKVSRTSFFPLLSGNYYPARQQTSGTLASNLSSNAYLYTLTTESLSVSYFPDVFGGTRRQAESTKAMEEVSMYQYEAVYLTLTANVVLNAINEAALREQIATIERVIQVLRDLSYFYSQEKRLGDIGIEVISQHKTMLYQTEALLPSLQLQLAKNRHLLASLLGRYSVEDLDIAFHLEDFVLPQELPLSLPSQLIENRPDIRAAEATMHVASAKIGVAMANRLPNINLSANGGYMPVSQSLSSVPYFLSPLPLGPSMFWTLGANLAGTIFDFGSLYYQKRAAVAAYNVSVAQYKRTVLNACQSVADSLKALELDAVALKYTQNQAEAAQTQVDLVKRKYHLGSMSNVALLLAQKSYQESLLSLVQTQALRFSDTVALVQALGGGWNLVKNHDLEKDVEMVKL